jgi:tRNA threonylcarbamoyladenosine biosynthesis protein TsaB
LLPVVREMLVGVAWRLADLDAVVVVHGPGSFTGVRVGLSAAKGLSEASGVGLIAVSRLAVLAKMAGRGEDAAICAVLDAGRGEFYGGVYEGARCVREALLSKDELMAAATAASEVIVCEAKVAEALEHLKPRMVREPLAGDVYGIALARAQAKAFDDAATIDANYLRRTDVEIFAKPVRLGSLR